MFALTCFVFGVFIGIVLTSKLDKNCTYYRGSVAHKIVPKDPLPPPPPPIDIKGED